MDRPTQVTTEGELASPAIFISYASADRKEALSVCRAIERRGARCWISARDVEPGGNYQEEIVRAIRDAPAMVLVFSKAANDSDEIKKELSLASRYRIPVIAFRIENVEPSDAFAYELSTRQWIDAFQSRDKSLDALVRKLEQINRKAPAPTRTAPPAHPWRFGRLASRPITAALGILLIVVAGTALLWQSVFGRQPLSVQIGGFSALAPVRADAAAAFAQELRAGFGEDNVVAVKDKNASFSLGGSIRALPNKVQYSVQLTDTRSGEMLWTADSDIDPASGELAPKQVATMVATVVRCGISDAMDYPGQIPTRALSLYLQHCRMAFWGDDGGPARRMDVMQKVVQLAPDFSKGWSALAIDAAAAADDAPSDKRAKLIATGKDAVGRALQLDQRNGQAYLASSVLIPASAWAERERLHQKSVDAHESDCGCEHENFGEFLLDVGRPREAVIQYSRAHDQQPYLESTLRGLASAYYFQGDVADGDQVMQDMVAFWKGADGLDRTQLRMATLAGRWGEAVKLAGQIYTTEWQRPIVDGFAALQSHELARMAAARAAVLQMPDDSATRGYRAILLAQLGAHRESLGLLASMEATNKLQPALLLDPRLAPLRSEPGWVAMLQRLGLIDYWRTSKKPPEICMAAKAPPFCRTI